MEVGNKQLSRDLIITQDELTLDLQPHSLYKRCSHRPGSLVDFNTGTTPCHTGSFRKDSLSRQSHMAVGSRLRFFTLCASSQMASGSS